MKQKLTDAERTLLNRRVADTEKQTGAQFVLASVRRSDSYAELPWKAFAFGASIASLIVLLLDLFFLGWLTETLIVFSVAAILAAGALMALLTVIFPGFARLFLSPGRRETETLQYAESLFLSRELFSTKDRRGILLLVSQFERQVVILPDTGVRILLNNEVLKEVIAGMKLHLRAGELRKAMEAGLEGIHEALASPLKVADGNNELANDIIEEEGI